MPSPLPDWSDGWGPTGSRCCRRRTVIVHAGWGAGTVVCCQVTGFSIDRCAGETKEAKAEKVAELAAGGDHA